MSSDNMINQDVVFVIILTFVVFAGYLLGSIVTWYITHNEQLSCKQLEILINYDKPDEKIKKQYWENCMDDWFNGK